jgi:SLBB domain-containing protein
MKLFFLSVFVLLSWDTIFSQNDDIIIGQNATKIGAALYDLSDPTGVNMEVNVWGTVRYPGRYRVPVTATFLDVMTYAGGPLENTKLDDIRIYRPGKDTVRGDRTIIKLDYEDLLYDEKIGNKLNPILMSGDVILLREEKHYSLRENIGLYLPIITSILSIITLVVTLRK